MLNAKQFNNSLCSAAQAQMVTHQQYRDINDNKSYKTVDGTIARIKAVDKVYMNNEHVGYMAYMNNGSKITALFDGTFYKTLSNGKVFKSDKELVSGHIRLSINNVSFIVEKWIGICKAIFDDCVPVSFKGWSVNVLDLSGNYYTARKNGLNQWFGLDNLEWCLNVQQLNHAKLVDSILHKTGHLYKISALDTNIMQVNATKSKEELIKYLQDNNYEIIK